MLAQEQETQRQTFPDSYGNIATDISNMSVGSQIQAANNFNSSTNSLSQTGQNVLNLSSSNQQQLQEIATKMMASFQTQPTLTPQQAQFFQMHSHSLPLNLNPQQQVQQQISLGQISNSSQDIYKSPQSPGYKSYHGMGQQPYKIPNQHPGSYNRQMRQHSPPHSQVANVLQQPPQQPSAKEMYRSNSLPINATISTMQYPNMQKEESFAVPRYQGSKNQRTSPSQQPPPLPCRSRSNSMVIKQGQVFPPPLQAAASEPMLNANSALLAQLLTSNQNSLLGKNVLQQRTVNSATNSPLVQTPQTSNASSIQLTKQSSNQMSTPSTSALSSSSSHSSCSSYLYSANTPTLSPDSAIDHDLPLSPDRGNSGGSKFQSRTDRRTGHIHAEQKRRYNIKNGFDLLHSLIPQLQQNPNAKVYF